MTAHVLRRHTERLLELEQIDSIRIGTKSLSYRAYKFATDNDGDETLQLFSDVVSFGRNLNADDIAAILPGLDVLISGFQPGNAAKDLAGIVRRSIAEPTLFSNAARALPTALEGHPRTRLVVIGVGRPGAR
ncbi:hypothetical protein ACH4HG_36465 [Streptomyces coeruleorubidus]|uniref:Uncharacterized protein n=1 Tax=Streptomyces coeruleorubidus TaxID=116188 RepID=A0ABZ0KEU9_STRC4|nr:MULTISPECIES: hypothetical protein [Streptomyces]WOT36378.1 hypothetical protein R5U08_20605 [Streptomyces coeruleorubidus]